MTAYLCIAFKAQLVFPRQGKDLKSTDTHPIKATKLALNIIRANEIAIENSKTGKVTAVAAILKVFGDKSNSRNSNPRKFPIKPNEWLN